ncbi:MAG TPA: phosphatidylglycerophosphatase A [Vicinamibacterales bacterium]
MRLAITLATVFGIGRIPFAPGTFGSLPGIALTIAARAYGPWWTEALLLVLIVVAGVWGASAAEEHFGRIDPGPVVIDEVAGMMLTLLFIPLSATGYAAGFFVFRACDVIKPFPANRLERLPGGFGVMADDLMAGVWGHAIVRGLAWAFPQWMLA